jgi:WD40 repeat protein
VGQVDLLDLTWSADDKLIATTDLRGRLITWDVVTGKAIKTYTAPIVKYYKLADVCVSPNGDELITVGDDGMIRFWKMPLTE